MFFPEIATPTPGDPTAMTEIEQLQQQVAKLQRRMTIVCSLAGIVMAGGLIAATMGMAGGAQNNAQNITASRIGIVDNRGNEIMTIGSTTEGMAGIWLKRGGGANPLLIQQADNTGNLWARSYKLESTATTEVAQFGISSQGQAGMWMIQGNRSYNFFLQTPDNNVKLWAHDYYVKHNNAVLASLGTSNNNKGGVWLYNGKQSKWALAINP